MDYELESIVKVGCLLSKVCDDIMNYGGNIALHFQYPDETLVIAVNLPDWGMVDEKVSLFDNPNTLFLKITSSFESLLRLARGQFDDVVDEFWAFVNNPPNQIRKTDAIRYFTHGIVE